MSTDTIPDTEQATATIEPAEPLIIQPKHGPELSPLDCYRASVISGDYSQALCEQAEKTESEWQWHRRVYLRRVDAARGLVERLPILERQAAAAEAEAASGPPVSPFDTRQVRAAAARDRASFFRRDNENFLLQTAAKPPADPNRGKLKCKIHGIGHRVAARQEVLHVEELIEAVRLRINGIVAGTISIVDQSEWKRAYFAGPPAGEQVVRENHRLLTEAKSELVRLLSLAKQTPEAAKENETDLATLADLQAALATIDAQRRLWQLEPQNMRFD